MNDSLRDPRRNADTFPCSYVGKRETWKDSSPVVTFNHEILLESISRLLCSSEAFLDTWPQDKPFPTPENTYLQWMRTGDSIFILISEEKGWIKTANSPPAVGSSVAPHPHQPCLELSPLTSAKCPSLFHAIQMCLLVAALFAHFIIFWPLSY